MNLHQILSMTIAGLLTASLPFADAAAADSCEALPQTTIEYTRRASLPQPVEEESADSASAKPAAQVATRLRFPEQVQRQKILDRQKIWVPGGERPDSGSVRSVMDLFYADQFRAFQDPEAPYFMLMSKDAHLALGLGGIINVRGWYDWNGAVPGIFFSPYNIPIPKDPTKMKRLYATPAGSGFFLTLLGRNTPVGDFFAYLEGGFRGYDRLDFRVRKAFIRVQGFTAGYTLSTFMDLGAMPPAMDDASYCGATDRANILVRYEHNWDSGWGLAGALEFPRTAVADVADGSVKSCDAWLPDGVAFGQYTWDEGFSHVRLSGLLRTLSYRDMLTERNHNKIGWGVALTAGIKVHRNLKLYGLAMYGAGHSSYLLDLGYGAHDLVGVAGRPGELQVPRAFSYLVGFKYHFRPDLYMGGSFSQLRNYEHDPADPAGYKYGMSGALNLFWEITPRLTTGAEVMMGKRMNFDHSSGVSNRAEILMQLSF